MFLKDYYAILKISPSATLPEIKKAYRELAKLYHPDTNTAGTDTTVRFAEIKEAYEVLSNHGKKEQYLQKRWYMQSIGRRKKRDLLTPHAVLLEVLELERYVASLDHFRMDKEGLQNYILEIFEEGVPAQLQQYQEQETIRQIIRGLIRSAAPLNHSQVNKLSTLLYRLASNDNIIRGEIEVFLKDHYNHTKKEKNLPLLILLITLLICLLIYFAGR